MKTVFVDTNFFIQCKGIDSLKWDDLLDKNETINILVPRAVQKEVDNFKGQGKGRRSKKAKAANELFGLILDSTNGYRLNNKLTLSFTSKKELANVPPEPSLDTTKNDDSIIQEVIAYRIMHPKEGAVLLTNDTGLMVTAKEYDIPYVRIPSSWLLEEEPDERDKQIQALKDEIANLKKNYPKINIDVSASKLTIKISEYPALTGPEIKKILSEYVKNAEYSAPHQAKLALGFREPSQAIIDRYNQEDLPNWQKKSEKHLKTFHLDLHRKRNSSEVVFKISNDGNFPAENLLVEFTASENLILFAPFNLEDVATRLPPLPRPPGITFMGIHPAILKSHTRIDSLPPLITTPPQRNPNKFYWKDHTYSKTDPMMEVYCACQEFRHKATAEEFSFFISAKHGSRITGGTITCKVSARNLQEPVTSTITVNFDHSNGDSFSQSYTEINVVSEE